MLRLCGLAVISAMSAYLLKRLKSELSFGIGIIASFVFFGAAISLMGSIIEEISLLLDAGNYSEYIYPVIKCLGIAFLVQIASGVCSDCGEGRLSEGIELVGKFEMLLICLPLIKSIVGYAIELISLE